MKSLWIPRLVLVAGALASVATSRIVTSWELSDDATLSLSTIEAAGSVTYPIQIELGGAGPYPALDGTLTATITIAPRTSPTLANSVLVRLASTTDATVFDESLWPRLGDDSNVVSISIPAWNGCNDEACAENLELVITSQSLEPLNADITGTLAVTAHAEGGDEAPEGTSISITVGAPQ
jgi:hypothetical protein